MNQSSPLVECSSISTTVHDVMLCLSPTAVKWQYLVGYCSRHIYTFSSVTTLPLPASAWPLADNADFIIRETKRGRAFAALYRADATDSFNIL